MRRFEFDESAARRCEQLRHPAQQRDRVAADADVAVDQQHGVPAALPWNVGENAAVQGNATRGPGQRDRIWGDVDPERGVTTCRERDSEPTRAAPDIKRRSSTRASTLRSAAPGCEHQRRQSIAVRTPSACSSSALTCEPRAALRMCAPNSMVGHESGSMPASGLAPASTRLPSRRHPLLDVVNVAEALANAVEGARLATCRASLASSTSRSEGSVTTRRPSVEARALGGVGPGSRHRDADEGGRLGTSESDSPVSAVVCRADYGVGVEQRGHGVVEQFGSELRSVHPHKELRHRPAVVGVECGSDPRVESAAALRHDVKADPQRCRLGRPSRTSTRRLAAEPATARRVSPSAAAANVAACAAV